VRALQGSHRQRLANIEAQLFQLRVLLLEQQAQQAMMVNELEAEGSCDGAF
jgi:hypothetical protein